MTDQRMRTRPTERPLGDRKWLAPGVAVAAVGWGANQFAPLLPLYRAEMGLGATTVQASFGLYALGLIPGLLLGGPLSDRHGRRRIMLPALVASMAGSGLLVAGGSSVGWLFAGRLVAGVASGAAFSSGAAWTRELSPGAANPGPRRATVAMTAGFAGGPLVAGALAQWAPWHTALPYLPHLLLAGVAVPLVLRAPAHRAATANARGSTANALGSTANARGSTASGRGPAGRPPGSIGWWREPAGRRFRSVVVPLAPWVFGSASVALAYLPSVAAPRLGGYALAFGAGVAGVTALAGIAVQPVARRVYRPGSARLLGTALGLVAAGLAVAAAAATGQPALVVVAAVVLGGGYGGCQVAGLLEVQRLAPPDRLAGLTALYQAVSYLGFAVPYLLAVGTRRVSPATALLVAAALAAMTLVRLTLVRPPATDGPATDGPATDGPATDGPATDGPATDGPVTDGPPAPDGPPDQPFDGGTAMP